MTEERWSYAVPAASRGRVLLRQVANRWPVRRERRESRRGTFLDTFDGRLHRAGLELLAEEDRSGVRLELAQGGGRSRARAAAAAVPGLAEELPPGPLAEVLVPVIENRRLLPRVAVDLVRERLAILDPRAGADPQAKTIARLAFERGTARVPEEDGQPVALPPRLVLTALAGYREEAAAVAEALAEGGEADPDGASPYELAAAALGRDPAGFSSRLELVFDPAAPAGEAVRALLRFLLEVVEANAPGAVADHDPEFLHDLRVAVRRTRSALAQLRGTLPRRTAEASQAAFGELGSATGPARDLDVLLAALPEYLKDLTEEQRAPLEPVLACLGERRRAAQEDLARVLEGRRCRGLLARHRRFLDRPWSARTAPDALRPVQQVAAERISRLWRKLRRQGGEIGPGSPAEDLHRLRITAKKLRYLMEFFRSLYPVEEIEPFVAALKKLQDVLGDANDLAVHQWLLEDLALELAAAGQVPPPAVLAAGRLAQALEGRRRAESELFAARFAALTTKEQKKRATHLFAAPEPR